MVSSEHFETEWVDFLERVYKNISDHEVQAMAIATLGDLSKMFSSKDRVRKVAQNALKFNFSAIPAGTFEMGSSQTDPGRGGNEKQHSVTLKGFEMQTTPVTQALWEQVMGSNPSHFKGPNLPVESVAWYEAQSFIEKLNALTQDGYKYRLPTEAEWEYAARGGTTTAYSFGDNPKDLEDYAWYSKNSGAKTHEVASKKPGPNSLYDMYGNVWQWVEDKYDENYGLTLEQLKNGVEDPTGLRAGSHRVLRGGSWDDDAEDLRSANRGYIVPDSRNSLVGFRLLRKPAQ